MPMSVDHCWTIPNLCTNGDVDLLQRHSYSPISDWWHRFILKYEDQLHLLRLFNSQHYIYGIHKISNSLANLKSICEIHCAFVRSPINCICNIDFLWSTFPVAILYSLSSKVIQRMGVFDKLIQCTMPILSSIPSTCIIPLHLFWAIVLLTIILLLFRVDVPKFFRYIVIGN